MKRGMVRTLVVAGAVAVVQGCSDGTGPGLLGATYRLERYEGAPLPAVIFQAQGTSFAMIAQTIVFRADGKGVVHTTTRAVDAQSPQGRDQSNTSAILWIVSGTRIEIAYVCPPDADCAPPPHLVGERIGNQLVLSPPSSSKLASIYARAD
jgi:hypothetical protein